jgi:3-deoxy-D-manno-octulosonate 8-phosphate phosphatase (KDO 8-P phosphatase)
VSQPPLDIKLLAMDVDGVLTDGGIIIHDDGSESKQFHVHDGAWLRIWKRQGLRSAIITGRQCPAVEHRARELEIDFVYQKAHDKVAVFEQLLADAKLSAGQVAYIGDDVMDLPLMSRVGFSAAVADANPLLLSAVQYVTTKPGGRGAVQELIHHLLGKMNLLDAALARYRL